MRPFLVESAKTKKPDVETDALRMWITVEYIEVEFPSMRNDNTFLVIHLIPRSKTSFNIVACWDTVFKGWLEILAQDKAVLNEVKRTWPVFTQILSNTVNNKYSEGVLSITKDPDNEEEKYVLFSVLGNIDVGDPSTWGDELMEAVFRIGALSLLLLEEMATKKLNDWRIIRDSAWLGTKDLALGILREYVQMASGITYSEPPRQSGNNVSLKKPPLFEYFENLREK